MCQKQSLKLQSETCRSSLTTEHRTNTDSEKRDHATTLGARGRPLSVDVILFRERKREGGETGREREACKRVMERKSVCLCGGERGERESLSPKIFA